MSLVLINRPPKQGPVPEGVPVWRTCLREVLFFHDEADAMAVGEPLVDGDAYRFLLEVICGLRSPMLGETQVMGQFKNFLATLDKDHAALRKLGQRMLSEARTLSEQHLRGLGSRSYGSSTYRHVAACPHVVVVGTGVLAKELLKFLVEPGRSVDQWGRRPATEVGSPASVNYRQFDDAAAGLGSGVPTAIVIAAPVPSAIVNDIASRYQNVRQVVDLRAELDLGPLRIDAPVVELSQLFAEIEDARRTAATHVAAARAGVARLSREYALRDEPHPFGWDDLCA